MIEPDLINLIADFQGFNDALDDLLRVWHDGDPFSIMNMSNFLIDMDARDKRIAAQRRKHRRYMDNVHKVQYTQATIPKVSQKNLPYQRRNY
jgi:hypothetical protein